MRLYIVSLLVALLCLLPEFAEIRNFELPGWLHMALLGPSVGLGYMEVFFHELGHTVTFWSFGQVAVPSFNFEDGGGVAVPLLPRSLILEGIVYAALIGLGVLLAQDALYPALAALIAVMLVHLWFSFGGERYQSVVFYMGHGGSVIVGCFCLLRAALNKTVSESSPEAERYLNMIFGIFVVLHNVMLSWKILTDSVSRSVYEQGIGGHITNDFVVVADQAHSTLSHVATFSLFFILMCLLVTVGLYFIFREPMDNETPMAPGKA